MYCCCLGVDLGFTVMCLVVWLGYLVCFGFGVSVLCCGYYLTLLVYVDVCLGIVCYSIPFDRVVQELVVGVDNTL